MSKDWVKDISDMQYKYGVKKWMHDNQDNSDLLNKYIEFRLKFIREELMETEAAFTNKDAEEIVDGLIDLCVVAIGTLDALGVDSNKAWDEVLKANLAKEVGVKESRPNPLGLPDLIKPEGWEAPSHEGNYGKLNNI
jgi:predicted HAD superfamily Cof-like phosphohydrolase